MFHSFLAVMMPVGRAVIVVANGGGTSWVHFILIRGRPPVLSFILSCLILPRLTRDDVQARVNYVWSAVR